MKVKRTKRSVNNLPQTIPTHHLISPHEMDIRIKTINTDIYEGTKNEQSKHDFNSKLYFKIFSGVAVLTAIIACLRRIGK